MCRFSESFSCFCFPFSSPPREGITAKQPENAGISSSELPENAGPSASQLSQQPQNAGLSSSELPENTGPSTSQLPQQSENAVPPTSTFTTTPHLDTFLHQLSYDPRKIHDLIKFIEDLLKKASGEKGEEGSSSQVSSYIEDGQTFMEFADKHIAKLAGEMKSNIDGLSAEASTILINLLKGAGKIHWVGAALSVVGFALDKINQMSRNREECLQILRRMVNLGKQIMKLNEEMPEQEKILKEGVACIVEGCIISTSQLSNTKIFRFVTSSVNADTLNVFNNKVDRLYADLQLWLTTDVHQIMPKNAPQSQELFERPEAVGIGSAQEKVIKLLDLSAQHTSTRIVAVHGFGGIGKTTLADAVYASIDLKKYKHSRIHMKQNCTENDIRDLQQQMLLELFSQRVTLNDCDQGRGLIRSLSGQNHNQPLFLYIDNGLKSTDLKQLLRTDLGDWLPLKSRILLTTRNLHETDIFVSRNVQLHAYSVIPLSNREGREILLKKVPDYNIVEESYIDRLLQLCGGVPLLLELAGSQLARNSKSRKNIVLEMILEGEKVEEEDISDGMVDFVYHTLLPPVQEAFMLIATFLYDWNSESVMLIIGEEEFRALEDASLIKIAGYDRVTIHDIVRARGEKISEEEGNIIISDRESLSKCLVDEKKLQKVKVICISDDEPPIEINESHLNCMSDSLRILQSGLFSPIKFQGKCRKPFKKLRCLDLPINDISELPMEFEKLEQLAMYYGPLTEEMSLYELPPSLRWMIITNKISSENGDAYSRIPAKLTPPPSLDRLEFWDIEDMERLPNGVEKLRMLEKLHIVHCPKLKELPSKIGDLINLEEIRIKNCPLVEEWPSSLGDLSKLKTLKLERCCTKLNESLPSHFEEN